MQTALASFRAELARVEKLADWLATPEVLITDMSPATWAIRCGAVVLLSGYFESFLRDCMFAFIRDVNALNKPIGVLPPRIRYVHFENGAKALSRLLKKEKQSGGAPVLCEDLTFRMASVRAAIGYTLVPEAFSQTRANPGPDTVADLLSGVGIQSVWSKLHASTPANLGDLKIFLTTFIAMRNECAHSGSTNSPPTASDLMQYCKNFEGMGVALLAVLNQRLTELGAL